MIPVFIANPITNIRLTTTGGMEDCSTGGIEDCSYTLYFINYKLDNLLNIKNGLPYSVIIMGWIRWS